MMGRRAVCRKESSKKRLPCLRSLRLVPSTDPLVRSNECDFRSLAPAKAEVPCSAAGCRRFPQPESICLRTLALIPRRSTTSLASCSRVRISPLSASRIALTILFFSSASNFRREPVWLDNHCRFPSGNVDGQLGSRD